MLVFYALHPPEIIYFKSSGYCTRTWLAIVCPFKGWLWGPFSLYHQVHCLANLKALLDVFSRLQNRHWNCHNNSSMRKGFVALNHIHRSCKINTINISIANLSYGLLIKFKLETLKNICIHSIICNSNLSEAIYH